MNPNPNSHLLFLPPCTELFSSSLYFPAIKGRVKDKVRDEDRIRDEDRVKFKVMAKNKTKI
jgi:hypothetical protein